MTRTKMFLVSGLAIIGMGTIASANPEADTNKDGVITRGEFLAAAQARFDKSDLNGDGYISQSERQNARLMHEAERKNEHFGRIDSNGDGVISRDEFEAAGDQRRDGRSDRRERMKSMADTDNDGTVSEAERAQMRERYEAGREEQRSRRENHAGRRGGGGQGPDPISRVDTNGDDLISAQEYIEGAERMFDHMDANGDGQLEKGEGRRSRKRRGSRRGR